MQCTISNVQTIKFYVCLLQITKCKQLARRLTVTKPEYKRKLQLTNEAVKPNTRELTVTVNLKITNEQKKQKQII